MGKDGGETTLQQVWRGPDQQRRFTALPSTTAKTAFPERLRGASNPGALLSAAALGDPLSLSPPHATKPLPGSSHFPPG